MSSGPSPTVSLDEATPGDLDLVVGYMRGLRADDPLPAGAVDAERGGRAAMAALLADPSVGRVWLIRFGSVVVGYVVLTLSYSIEFGGRCGFVDELYVDSIHRGRGVGRQALERVSAAAARLGVRVLLLEVSAANERACNLYQSTGFAERPYRLMMKKLA